MGSNGSRFTWRGGIRNGYGRVYERLDRCFGNMRWRHLFQEANVLVLPRVRSDHHPILVELEVMSGRVNDMARPFRFEAAWLQHSEFTDFIRKSWEAEIEMLEALESLSSQLKVWNKEVYGNIFQRKKKGVG